MRERKNPLKEQISMLAHELEKLRAINIRQATEMAENAKRKPAPLTEKEYVSMLERELDRRWAIRLSQEPVQSAKAANLSSINEAQAVPSDLGLRTIEKAERIPGKAVRSVLMSDSRRAREIGSDLEILASEIPSRFCICSSSFLGPMKYFLKGGGVPFNDKKGKGYVYHQYD